MAIITGVHGETYEVPDEPVVETTETPTNETPVEVNTEVTPTVVTETPAAETPTEPVVVEAPVVETPIAEAPTEQQIKEVEKIIIQYPELDEFQSNILSYIQEGKLSELGQFIAESQRDYGTMSDYDVIKSNLLKNNSNYTDEIAALKIEMQYGDIVKMDTKGLDEESVEYAEAIEHNKTVDRNLKMLKIDAIDARAALETGKKGITLPKLDKPVEQPPVQQVSPEVQEAIKNEWISYVDKEVPQVQEFAYKVGDKESGYEDVSFKVTDKDRAEMSDFLKTTNVDIMFKRLGWVDENGKQNIQKMAGDVLKLEKLPHIISSVYTQGKTTGAKGTVAEIKNIDLTANSQSSVAATQPDIGALVWGHINPK